MDLKTMIKNPRVRFKTIHEMIEDYGPNWMDLMPPYHSEDILNTMGYYQGKVLYPSLIDSWSWNYRKTSFCYGPSMLSTHMNMITTKSIPKYDFKGNILKPGMLVKVEYLAIGPQERHIIPSDLRNEPGTIVKVLKVVNPSDYLYELIPKSEKDKIDFMYIATELRNPFSGAFIDKIGYTHRHMFRNKQICAFEIMHRVIKANDIEKQFFNKMTRR